MDIWIITAIVCLAVMVITGARANAADEAFRAQFEFDLAKMECEMDPEECARYLAIHGTFWQKFRASLR